jgi:nondiscriminating glutamyl-tRNA synthetase
MEASPFNKIRVRIAPSPTGKFHIGTARTALFNYLFAKKNDGAFVLRIEDTDIERSKIEFEEDIIENLKWLKIDWTEGPVSKNQAKDKDTQYMGQYGPYRQSKRIPIYEKYLGKLLKEGKAYRCFCSKEELEAKRQYQVSIGKVPKYDGTCRNLSEDEIKKNLEEEKPYVIRFKNPGEKVIFNDLIRGRIEIDSSLMGDFVIAKSITEPLYNFAVVVDDFEMEISHVIRGEDHVSNTPKQILIQEALEFPRPRFGHLPLILGPDKAKLSKRHAVTSVSEYKKEGYLPEALINFMAFLGWNPGTDEEVFSLSSLIKEFSLERVQKGGAVFNIKRLDYLNGYYIRHKPLSEITQLCIPYLIENNLITPKPEAQKTVPRVEFLGVSGVDFSNNFIINETGKEVDFNFLKKIVSLYRERLKKLSEITELTDFFFKEKPEYEKELLMWKSYPVEEIKISLDKSEEILSKIENWEKENLTKILLQEAEKIKEGDRGYLLWPLRASLTGKKASASPFEVSEVLGKEESLKRIKRAKEML